MDESWRHCFATWALLLCKPIVANEIDRKKPKLSDQKVSGIGRPAAPQANGEEKGHQRRVSGVECRVSDVGRWMLGVGCCVSGVGCRVSCS